MCWNVKMERIAMESQIIGDVVVAMKAEKDVQRTIRGCAPQKGVLMIIVAIQQNTDAME